MARQVVLSFFRSLLFGVILSFGFRARICLLSIYTCKKKQKRIVVFKETQITYLNTTELFQGLTSLVRFPESLSLDQGPRFSWDGVTSLLIINFIVGYVYFISDLSALGISRRLIYEADIRRGFLGYIS